MLALGAIAGIGVYWMRRRYMNKKTKEQLMKVHKLKLCNIN